MITYSKDGAEFAKKELAHNSTLAILKSVDDSEYKAYRMIEDTMECVYEPFSIVFDDGILVHNLVDNSVQFILNIEEDSDKLCIHTTNDQTFYLSKQVKLHSIDTSTNLLTPILLEDADFTDVFVTKCNSLVVGDNTLSAFYDKQHRQILICNGIKRFGYLVAYNDKAYLLNNDNNLFLFFYDKPDIDISSRYKDLGEFLIQGNQIFFRTNYGYKSKQDLVVHDIITNSGRPITLCSTEVNPDRIFQVEV